MAEVRFKLNGKDVVIDVDAKERLVDTLRKRFHLTGTKLTCGTGDCGACTVLFNGKAIRSCTTLTCMADGQEVVTIEGVMPMNGGKLHPVQRAFMETGAIQCGYCTPGMILSGIALLNENPDPTLEEVQVALAGNLCRCTGYWKIFDAILLAGKWMREGEPAE